MTDTVKVWDLFIRVFHWTLALAFIVAYLTEGEVGLHFYVGWYIGVLVFTRIIWGFVGGKYARFSNFVRSPATVISYAKSMLSESGQKMRYLGHNPLGGLMVVALLLSLSATVATGIAYYAEENSDLFAFTHQPILQEHEEDHEERYEGRAYLTEHDEGDEHEESAEREQHEEDEWKEIHEFFANFTLLLVILHIAGVVWSSRLDGENLPRAMLTGRKRQL